jgi:hypothetical protein
MLQELPRQLILLFLRSFELRGNLLPRFADFLILDSSDLRVASLAVTGALRAATRAKIHHARHLCRGAVKTFGRHGETVGRNVIGEALFAFFPGKVRGGFWHSELRT